MSAPKLPDGAVMLGLGQKFETAGLFAGYRFCVADGDTGWAYDDEWEGCDPDAYYAADANSEIARLNGHPVEPAAESEAVALVLKLADAYRSEVEPHQRTLRGSVALKEAEAFLALEGKK